MELVNQELTNIIAIVAMVAGILLAVWWLVGLYSVHTRKQEHELPEVDLPADLHETISGVPAFLWIFILLTGVTLVAYVVSVWLSGVSY
ncbi:MAG: hypothetical protein M1133_05035 [Armatimonadetes bacterium]|nr:hypothetical protein [Armatimonadota bacterium]